MQCPRCHAHVEPTDAVCRTCGLTREQAASFIAGPATQVNPVGQTGPGPTGYVQPQQQGAPPGGTEPTGYVPLSPPGPGAQGAGHPATPSPSGGVPSGADGGGGSGTWLVGLLALLVLAVGVGAVALTWPWGGDDGSSSSSGPPSTANGFQDPTAQDPTAQDPTAQDPTAQDPTAQDPTTVDGPTSTDGTGSTPTGSTDGTGSTPTGSTPTGSTPTGSSSPTDPTSDTPGGSSPTSGDGGGSYATGATFVQQWTDAINNRDYDTWSSIVSPQRAANQPRGQWMDVYGTTDISNVEVVDVSRSDGRIEVWFRMRSTQSSEQGPDGLTCADWSLDYVLGRRGGEFVLVDAGPHGRSAGYTPC